MQDGVELIHSGNPHGFASPSGVGGDRVDRCFDFLFLLAVFCFLLSFRPFIFLPLFLQNE